MKLLVISLIALQLPLLAHAGFTRNELADCQFLLKMEGPAWLDRAMDEVIMPLTGARLRVADVQDVRRTRLSVMFAPYLTTEDLSVVIDTEDNHLGLRFQSESIQSTDFYRFGTGQLISHTDGRQFLPHIEVGLRIYSHVLLQLEDPRSRKAFSNIYAFVNLTPDIAKKGIFIVELKNLGRMRSYFSSDDFWFNTEGELMSRKILAKLVLAISGPGFFERP